MRSPGAYASVTADCTVNSGGDTNSGAGGAGSGAVGDLRYCMTLVQAQPTGGIIAITTTSDITLEAALPDVLHNTTISGPSNDLARIRRTATGSPTFGFLKVAGSDTPDLTLVNLDIQGFTNIGPSDGVIMAKTVRAGAVSIYGSTISNNSSYFGPVYAYYGGDMTITDSTFSGNQGVYGGAVVFVGLNSSLTVTDSTFTSNVSTNSAGALFANTLGGEFTLRDSTFTSNVAQAGTSSGGAIWSMSPVNRIYGSAFVDNEAGYGGAIYMGRRAEARTFVMEESTFRGNSATHSGGAIYLLRATSEITNSSIVANSAATSGAAIFNGGTSTAALKFTTVAGNSTTGSAADIALPAGALSLTGSVVSTSGTACAGAVSADTYSVVTDTSCGLTGAGSVSSATAADLALGTVTTAADSAGIMQSYYMPSASSILVTGAAPDALGTGVTTDQIGLTRTGPFTIGAKQFVAAASPVVSTVAPSSGPVAGGTEVTISGSGFTGATAVQFGATAARSFTVRDDSTITAVAPAGVQGLVAVEVTGPGGASNLPSAFRYVAAPGAVRNLTALVSDTGVVTLTWRAPAQDGGAAVTSYRVFWRVRGSHDWNQVSPNATQAKAVLRGLRGGKYWFAVTPVNTAGAGDRVKTPDPTRVAPKK